MSDSELKFYVTTPIYYVTAKPHLGSLYSTVLADVAARWHKLLGQRTFFLTGTDEHGQKVFAAAQAASKEPLEFVESFIGAYKDLWANYNIKYDYFIRTTQESHIKAVQLWIKRLQDKGEIYKAFYKGWYCTPCETFITEKQSSENVSLSESGTDKSGPNKSVTDKSISCGECGRPTQYLSEESYFFKLSAYQDALLKFYKENPDFITPKERFAEVISFVKSGLRDLSISRTTVSWGIPFPGDTKHTTYVWADALNNYITAIGYGNPDAQKEFNFWWPADLQIMGKDIIRFHAVYWPAFLMACDLKMPKKLLVHGWIKVNQQKMSKSLSNVIDPQDLLKVYGADAVRYYLVKHMAITQDAEFSIKDLETLINSDLANDLGNLLNRMTALSYKFDLINIQAPSNWSSKELELRDMLWNMLNIFKENMAQGYFYRAYNALWDFIGTVNAYFHTQEPWKIAQTDKQRFSEIISATCHSLYAIAILAWPCMPKKMEELLKSLGHEIDIQESVNIIDKLDNNPWSQNFLLSKIEPLFIKYESQEAQESSALSKEKPKESSMQNITQNITIDDFSKVMLVVGTIESCEEIQKSDKLYKLQVNFGENSRQVLSGIRQYYKPEELIGKQAVFVYNLQPRTMMGFESHGMVLTVQDTNNKARIITIDPPVANGTRLK